MRLRHDGIYRADGYSKSLGQSTASRWSVPGQAKGRDGRGTPCPSFAMSSDRLFLDRVARQHRPSPLHRQGQNIILDEPKETNYHRTVNSVLTVCLSPRGNPIRFQGHRKLRQIDAIGWRNPLSVSTKHGNSPVFVHTPLLGLHNGSGERNYDCNHAVDSF